MCIRDRPIAQLVEQFPFKEWVGGSSPPGLTKTSINLIAIILLFASLELGNKLFFLFK